MRNFVRTRPLTFSIRQFINQHVFQKMEVVMKVVSSLKTIKSRDRHCQLVRRRGRLYVINKRNPRLKARQG